MAKSYFYSVVFCHQVDKEEQKIEEQFKDDNLIKARSDAFSCAKETFDKYSAEFTNEEHPIGIEMTINFNIGSVEKEYEDGFPIYSDYIKPLILYHLFFRKLEENENIIMKEMELLKSLLISNKDQDIYAFAKKLATNTGEIEIINSIRKSISNIDPKKHEDYKSNMQIIECTRCAKKMEVENRIARLFYDKRYRGSKISMACDTCIKVYYSDPQFDFSLQEIYNKNGKTIVKRGRDIDYYEKK